MRVIKQLDGKPSKNLAKILVTETTGHDELLDFLSVYQTQDKFRGVHYHPEGALCWYSCNQYGEPDGGVVFARKVPIRNLMWRFDTKRKFRMGGFSRKREWKEAFSAEPKRENLQINKPKLYQPKDRTKKRGHK